MLNRDEKRATHSLDWRLRAKGYPGRRGLKGMWRGLEPEVRSPVPERGIPREPVKDVDEWLETLYELSQRRSVNPAIDFVLETVGELILQKQYNICDTLLRKLDIGKLSVHAMLTVLMETFRAKTAVPSRSDFYQRVEKRLRLEVPERVDALLAGLK